MLLQPVYGALVSRYPRRVFLPMVYGFFIATLLLFYVLFDTGVPGRGMAFFLWVTVFNPVCCGGVLELHRRCFSTTPKRVATTAISVRLAPWGRLSVQS
ncbi:hypothetical protein GDR29_07035 [Xanthomonas oryzae pv. oryzae]|nr:hypothetical protein GDR29_07035 [Xanthomonas oryzae pv. oryzae]